MTWNTTRPVHTGSAQWKRIRRQVLATSAVCYLQYDGCTVTATEVDHIVPVSRGGADSIDNVSGACHHCHSIKTQHEAAAGSREWHKQHSRLREPEKHPGIIH